MLKSILVKLPEQVWKAFRTMAIDRGISNAKLVEQLVSKENAAALAASPKFAVVERTPERDELLRQPSSPEVAEQLLATIPDKDPSVERYGFSYPPDVKPPEGLYVMVAPHPGSQEDRTREAPATPEKPPENDFDDLLSTFEGL